MSVRKKAASAVPAAPKSRTPRKKSSDSSRTAAPEETIVEKKAATAPKGTLIIVESPTKARTLTRILGSGYKVKASVGHLKDLPPSKIGVDVDNGYELQFVVSEGKKKVLDEIRQAARGAREIFLASDPDREGEAIAYHIASELTGLKKPIRRVLVHELTPRGIEAALAEPGEIDLHKVDAQKARRALDRIVGYSLSPLLWERVRRGLSAGRVQSVAVRLVCDRENEIRAFVPEEYWTITLSMRPSDPGRSDSVFTARLDRIAGRKVQISNADEARKTVERIGSEGFRIDSLSADEKRRQPSPPLTTSRLQQEGARRFRFSAKKTMQLAQKLYEGVDLPGQGQTGLITYMRTDSVRLAPEAQEMARKFIASAYPQALPPRSPAYRNKKGIQDAHEAIRPTDVSRTPDSLEGILDRDLLRVYRLIWQTFLESQMVPARYLLTTVIVEGDKGDTFRATGRRMLDPGFLVLRGEEVRARKKSDALSEEEGEEKGEEENELPLLHEGEAVEGAAPPESQQHFTEPPPRYNEASLIRELEEKGIGRPSTYATIMTTILDREYVEKRENRFHPTELGETVNRLLVDSFPDLLNVAFTARMEEELDSVEEGEKIYREAVDDFYRPFSKELSKAKGGGMANLKAQSEPTTIPCPVCGTLMVKKWGRHGAYLACGNYPACKTTRNIVETENGPAPEVLPEAAGEICSTCGKPMVVRKGRFGTFLACSDYPACKTTRPWPPKGHSEPPVPLPANIPPCPACGGAMVLKTGRFGSFLSCANYPKCKTTRPLPTGIVCTRPGCGGEITPRKGKRGTFYGCSHYPECDRTYPGRPVDKPCPLCGHAFLIEKKSGKKTVYSCPEKGCGYESEDGEESGITA